MADLYRCSLGVCFACAFWRGPILVSAGCILAGYFRGLMFSNCHYGLHGIYERSQFRLDWMCCPIRWDGAHFCTLYSLAESPSILSTLSEGERPFLGRTVNFFSPCISRFTGSCVINTGLTFGGSFFYSLAEAAVAAASLSMAIFPGLID